MELKILATKDSKRLGYIDLGYVGSFLRQGNHLILHVHYEQEPETCKLIIEQVSISKSNNPHISLDQWNTLFGAKFRSSVPRDIVLVGGTPSVDIIKVEKNILYLT